MALAGAGIADQQDRLATFKVAALGQSADTVCRDVRRLREVELFQRLDPGQVCFVHAQFDGPSFAVFYFGPSRASR